MKLGTSWLKPVTSHPLARRLADAALVRYAHHRVRQLDSMDVAAVQERTLFRLLRYARNTQFGREHDFAKIRSIAEYQARVPLREYEAFWKTYWQPVYPNITGTTWPDHIPYYGLSSGTTSGATKYIPISRQMVTSNRNVSFTLLAFFRHWAPRASTFTGETFFLGGSTTMQRQDDGSYVGDLSGVALRELADFLRPYLFPPPELSTIANWEEKVQRFAQEAANRPITVLSGIPAWVLVLFDHLKKVTGKATISEIWPEMKLFIHGGTKFDPYRELFRKEIGSDTVRFLDTYPCSEGYIATEDPRYDLLRMIPDHGIFFEFVPVEDLGKDRPTRHTLANAQVGVQYAIVLTTCAGLWSYVVGDTIAFERTDVPLIRFTGRTKYFLSAFGEHLISEEVEKAVAEAASACAAHVVDFHVGPIFPTAPNQPGHHRFLIEFRTPPNDLAQFERLLDQWLDRLNEDYRAHRVGDLSMLAPKVVVVPTGGYEAWMRSRGKHGGQNKVPRMDNSGTITQQISQFIAEWKPQV